MGVLFIRPRDTSLPGLRRYITRRAVLIKQRAVTDFLNSTAWHNA